MSVLPTEDSSGAKQVTVALVGYGYWGPKLARCISSCNIAQLSSICELSPARTAAARADYPNVPISGLDEILNDSRISAVIVATPVDAHADVARRCLRKGKHVMVEKPFTGSLAEAKSLAQESRRAGTVLMVDYTYLFSPEFEQIRALVARRNLGPLRYYQSTRLNCFGPAHETDVLRDLAVHDLSMLDALMPSAPQSIQAMGLRSRHARSETQAQLTLSYADGAMASVLVSWVGHAKARTVILGFDQHTVVWDDLARGAEVKLFHRGLNTDAAGEDQTAQQAETVEVPITEPLLNAVSHFLECIRSGAQPRSDVACGLRINQILEAAVRSISTGGLPTRPGARGIAA